MLIVITCCGLMLDWNWIYHGVLCASEWVSYFGSALWLVLVCDCSFNQHESTVVSPRIAITFNPHSFPMPVGSLILDHTQVFWYMGIADHQYLTSHCYKWAFVVQFDISMFLMEHCLNNSLLRLFVSVEALRQGILERSVFPGSFMIFSFSVIY